MHIVDKYNVEIVKRSLNDALNESDNIYIIMNTNIKTIIKAVKDDKIICKIDINDNSIKINDVIYIAKNELIKLIHIDVIDKLNNLKDKIVFLPY